jgi:hypothetical protein
VNPALPVGPAEAARWLRGFAASHAKRESPLVEVQVEPRGEGTAAGLDLRLTLGGRQHPPAGEAPIRLGAAEVAEGRTRLAWCEALAARVRQAARDLVAGAAGRGRPA